MIFISLGLGFVSLVMIFCAVGFSESEKRYSKIATTVCAFLAFGCAGAMVVNISRDVDSQERQTNDQMRTAFSKVERVQQRYYVRYQRYAPTVTDLRMFSPALNENPLVSQMIIQPSADNSGVYISLDKGYEENPMQFSLTAADGLVIDRSCHAESDLGCQDGQWQTSER